jgi:hypothetical protein
MIGCLIRVVGGIALFAASIGSFRAATILVPNASFESPPTSFVDINIDSWQKSAKPADYNESGGYLWTQLTGVFSNTDTTSSDHIDNCDGQQALWLFAVPKVGLFQDYDSMDWNDPVPTHAFNATFEPGNSYQLTVGIIGTGGGMLEGASLELSLYYRVGSNNVPVAVTSVSNTPTIFSNNTHLIDFQVQVPAVKPSDPWANQHIGIQFLSTVTSNLQGGYWDLDNVRLAAIREPVLANPVWTNGQFQFTLQSEPGLKLQILAATNIASPASNWFLLGTLTNLTGATQFTDSTSHFIQRFYRVQELP